MDEWNGTSGNPVRDFCRCSDRLFEHMGRDTSQSSNSTRNDDKRHADHGTRRNVFQKCCSPFERRALGFFRESKMDVADRIHWNDVDCERGAYLDWIGIGRKE